MIFGRLIIFATRIISHLSPELPPYLLALFPEEKSYPIDVENTLSDKERQELRLKTIERYCQSDYHRHDCEDREISAMQYSIFEKHQVAECRVPKTGTSYRSKVLWGLHHNDTTKWLHPRFDKAVLKLNAQEYRKSYEKTIKFRFMFVRDPFERAISSYFNKVVTGEFLNNKSMTLEDFFRHLNKEKLGNEHFVTELSLCNPCLSKMSFLGRAETLDKDLDYIINEATDFHRNISFHGTGEKFNSAKRDPKKYKTLTKESVIHFVWKNRHDYLAFGYNPHHALGSSLGNELTSENMKP